MKLNNFKLVKPIDLNVLQIISLLQKYTEKTQQILSALQIEKARDRV